MNTEPGPGPGPIKRETDPIRIAQGELMLRGYSQPEKNEIKYCGRV